MGSVLGDSSQRAIQVRIAGLLAGIPENVPVHTVNRWEAGIEQMASLVVLYTQLAGSETIMSASTAGVHATRLTARCLEGLLLCPLIFPGLFGAGQLWWGLCCPRLHQLSSADFEDVLKIRGRPCRQCSSGLQAIASVAASIQAGFYDIGLAGGLESMSTNPMAWDGGVNPKIAENQKAQDCLLPMGERPCHPVQRSLLTRPILSEDQPVGCKRW